MSKALEQKIINLGSDPKLHCFACNALKNNISNTFISGLLAGFFSKQIAFFCMYLYYRAMKYTNITSIQYYNTMAMYSRDWEKPTAASSFRYSELAICNPVFQKRLRLVFRSFPQSDCGIGNRRMYFIPLRYYTGESFSIPVKFRYFTVCKKPVRKMSVLLTRMF